MPISTVSSKGQVTLPSALRKRLGIRPHDRVSIEGDAEGIVISGPRTFSSSRAFWARRCRARPNASEWNARWLHGIRAGSFIIPWVPWRRFREPA